MLFTATHLNEDLYKFAILGVGDGTKGGFVLLPLSDQDEDDHACESLDHR